MPNRDVATRTLNLCTIFFFLIFMYLAMPGFSCGMRDPVFQPGTEPGPSALGGGATSWQADSSPLVQFSSVQSLSQVQLFATP